MVLTDEEKISLTTLVKHFEEEDKSTRDRQIRAWRRLKLLWDGFQRVWYSEVAHDWRIFDEQADNDSNQQDYYNKPVNVFRAYLESIIAALSITIPPIKCYPDDADNSLDLATAGAGDKIAELIARHNQVGLLWLHALYIYCTEGMVACYNYTKEDKEYGTYSKKNYQDFEEDRVTKICPDCKEVMDIELNPDEYDPSIEEYCPACDKAVTPEVTKEKVTITRMVGETKEAKARQCMEVYGGLYVKVANYAKRQSDCPYLIWSYETNYALARDRYADEKEFPGLREKIQPGMGNPGEPYARWGRNNPQYYGEMPTDSVTIRNAWLRPASFEILEKEKCDALKKKFPNGAKVVMVEQEFAEACDESLDDHWTLTNNPLSDFVYFDPIGLLLTSIQEITNDLVSLTLQTIEHGIPQTFADDKVLNFKAYGQLETTPGAIYPATPRTGKSIGDGFHEVKTASLSAEVFTFATQIQNYGQLVSGATPSLFGGQASGGSQTASEYSMSRAQAQQRLGSTWKMFTFWWRDIFGKVIPAYIKTVQEDERTVEKDSMGNFVNVLIRKAELEGKLGRIEIEANENLPMSWSQRRDTLMKLMEANNPQILGMLAQPENLPLIYEMIGIPDFYVPGEDDRNKQYDEIKQLLASEPIEQPPPDELVNEAVQSGGTLPIPPNVEVPSVEVDPVMDNHVIEFNICQKWAISEAGRLAKIENPPGYKNVLLHAVAHKQLIPPPMPEGGGAAPLGNPTQDKNAPVTGDKDVPVQA